MTLVFGLLLFILKKFAWKPIMSALKEREQDIASSLDLAKQTKSEMKQLKADNEKLLIEARNEREAILVEANKMKDQIIKDAKGKAEVEAGRIVETALANIESEKRAALTEIKSLVASLSIDIAEKVLASELSDKKKQTELVEKQLEHLNFN
jgi:F-type H+-transporting ATPase subunit b